MRITLDGACYHSDDPEAAQQWLAALGLQPAGRVSDHAVTLLADHAEAKACIDVSSKWAVPPTGEPVWHVDSVAQLHQLRGQLLDTEGTLLVDGPRPTGDEAQVLEATGPGGIRLVFLAHEETVAAVA